MWWLMRQKQEDLCESEANEAYIGSTRPGLHNEILPQKIIGQP